MRKIFLLVFLLFILNGCVLLDKTGKAVDPDLEVKEVYTDEIDVNIDESMIYQWVPKNDVKLDFVKISGYFEGDSFEIHLLDNLVYEYGNEESFGPSIMGEGDDEIVLFFDYGDGDNYDNNNDGMTYENSVIDFKVNADFYFDVDYNKLCTKYVVNSIEGAGSVICYGNDECCSFPDGLESLNPIWNADFYLNKGRHGSEYDNQVSARVIYYDINLNPDDIRPYIYNSEKIELPALFTETAYFEEECVDTCLLDIGTQRYYDFMIITDGLLHIDSIAYS